MPSSRPRASSPAASEHLYPDTPPSRADSTLVSAPASGSPSPPTTSCPPSSGQRDEVLRRRRGGLPRRHRPRPRQRDRRARAPTPSAAGALFEDLVVLGRAGPPARRPAPCAAASTWSATTSARRRSSPPRSCAPPRGRPVRPEVERAEAATSTPIAEQRHHLRPRPGRHRQELAGRGDGRAGPAGQGGAADHPHPPGRGGRRAARLPAGRPHGEGRPVPAPALRTRSTTWSSPSRAPKPARATGRSRWRRSRSCAAARSTTAFIILDEAQNTTPEQMKMFLTRIGFGSKVVVTGDTTQVDVQGGAQRPRRPRAGAHRHRRARPWCTSRAPTSSATASSQDIVDAYERATPAADGEPRRRTRPARSARAPGGRRPRRAAATCPAWPAARAGRPRATSRCSASTSSGDEPDRAGPLESTSPRTVLLDSGVRGEAELSLLFVDRAGDGRPEPELHGQGGPHRRAGLPDRRPATSTPGRWARSPAAAGPDREPPELDELPLLLGDVVVCPAVAARQAPTHAGSLRRRAGPPGRARHPPRARHGPRRARGDRGDGQACERAAARQVTTTATSSTPTVSGSRRVARRPRRSWPGLLFLARRSCCRRSPRRRSLRRPRPRPRRWRETSGRRGDPPAAWWSTSEWLNPVLLVVLSTQLVQSTLLGVLGQRPARRLGRRCSRHASSTSRCSSWWPEVRAEDLGHPAHRPGGARRPRPGPAASPALPPLDPVPRASSGSPTCSLPGKGLKRGPYTSEEELLGRGRPRPWRRTIIEEEEQALIESVIELGDTVVRGGDGARGPTWSP